MSEQNGAYIVKESEPIPDGTHTGEIIKVERRNTEYDYTDFVIKLLDDAYTEKDVQLRIGFPTNISINKNGEPQSNLAKFMARLGRVLSKNSVVLPSEFVGQKVQFMTVTQSTAKGDFARIVAESIKPIIE